MIELFHSPLTGLLLTLVIFQLFQMIYKRFRQHPLLHPVLLSTVVIALVLSLTGISYEDYWAGAQLIHFLLGPATVALAIPLYLQWERISNSLVRVVGSAFVGSITGIVSAVGLAWLLEIPNSFWPSIAPKSATTPIAMGVAEKVGGDPKFTALFVVLTGVFGAMVGVSWLKLLRIRDERAVGCALGVASHGIGTSRAVQAGPMCAAYASLGMGLCGLLTAVFVPIFFKIR